MSGFDWSETKRVIGVAVILVTGFWGFVITFSDVPPEWTPLRWAGYIAVSHMPSAAAVGFLFSPRWAWGTAAGWAALLMLLSYRALAVAALVLAVLVLSSFLGGKLAVKLRRG
jgi:hypothetical protein